jgi:predicted GNAT family N-acyltransferase
LLGGDLYVKKATVEFNASARMDDRLDIALKCARIGNSSMAFTGAIFRGDELLVTCELVYVFADPATQTSKPVPLSLRSLMEGYEKGEPAFEVKTGSWAELGPDAQRIRTEVFVGEQRIPADLEWDEADATAVHAVAYNRLGQAIGTGRLVQQSPDIARIGRMAVHRAIRGAGVGQGILEALLEAAARRGDREAMLHAQRSAEAFYAGLGFTPRGEPFEEAGIAHVEMTRALASA